MTNAWTTVVSERQQTGCGPSGHIQCDQGAVRATSQPTSLYSSTLSADPCSIHPLYSHIHMDQFIFRHPLSHWLLTFPASLQQAGPPTHTCIPPLPLLGPHAHGSASRLSITLLSCSRACVASCYSKNGQEWQREGKSTPPRSSTYESSPLVCLVIRSDIIPSK